MKAVATVYLLTNQHNGHAYVGVTRFASAVRWAQHVYRAAHMDTFLARAIRKHGAPAFQLTDMASCLSAGSAGSVEAEIIRRIAPVYNQTNGGEITVGRTATPEVRAKIRARALLRRFTPEQKAAQSVRKKAEYQSNPAFRASALAALARGRANVEGRAKRIAAVAASARGREWSAESRAKLSASCMGRVYPKHILDKIAAAKRKPVVCAELQRTFSCCDEAAARLGLSTSSIYKVCVGARPSVGGLTFSYGA